MIRYHQLMAAITGLLFDVTGNDLMAHLWTHHMGRILSLEWAAEAERLERGRQRIADALNEIGIF